MQTVYRNVLLARFRHTLFMHVAKIIRHRHKYYHFMNGDLKDVKEETFFKIVFSHPEQLRAFKKWCRDNKGEYSYDKDNSRQEGEMPQLKIMKGAVCWCDIMAYYLLHVAGYTFKATISPYKGEVYIKAH